jgi:hypothetical protein
MAARPTFCQNRLEYTMVAISLPEEPYNRFGHYMVSMAIKRAII